MPSVRSKASRHISTAAKASARFAVLVLAVRDLLPLVPDETFMLSLIRMQALITISKYK